MADTALPAFLDPVTESLFQTWYAQKAKAQHLNPNPDDKAHYYDYRAAYLANAKPNLEGHWSSEYKLPGHPREYLDTGLGRRLNTRTGIVEDYLTMNDFMQQSYRFGESPTSSWTASGDTTKELFRTLMPTSYNVRNSGLQQVLGLLGGLGVQSAMLGNSLPQIQQQYRGGYDQLFGGLAGRGMSNSGLASQGLGALRGSYSQMLQDALMKAQQGQDQFKQSLIEQLGNLVNTDIGAAQNTMIERGYGQQGMQNRLAKQKEVAMQQGMLGNLFGTMLGNVGSGISGMMRQGNTLFSPSQTGITDGSASQVSGSNNLWTNPFE